MPNRASVITTSSTKRGSVTQATAILTGFIVKFSHGDDHHLGQLDVQAVVPAGVLNGAVVTVNATIGLRDWSNDRDDQDDGQIFFSVIGE